MLKILWLILKKGILDDSKNRGIYGVFIEEMKDRKEYCTYIGRSVNIYARFFVGKDAHFVRLRKGKLFNESITEALYDESKK